MVEVLAVVVTAACVQDRDAAKPLLCNLARARDYERLSASREAKVLRAMIVLMIQRLATD